LPQKIINLLFLGVFLAAKNLKIFSEANIFTGKKLPKIAYFRWQLLKISHIFGDFSRPLNGTENKIKPSKISYFGGNCLNFGGNWS
jgi:hypothetical protein